MWVGGGSQHSLLPLSQREKPEPHPPGLPVWTEASLGHAKTRGCTALPKRAQCCRTVRVSFRAEGWPRLGEWTLGSGWGRGVPINLGTVCLPGPDSWRLGGRACPEQWLEPGLASSGGEGPGGCDSTASVQGCDLALPLLPSQMWPPVLEAWTVP